MAAHGAPHSPFLLLLLLLAVRSLCCSSLADDVQTVVSRIAFGSCANQSAPQPIWSPINKFDPQIFIWLGDNIYGDVRRPFKLFGKERTIGPWKNVPRFVMSSKQEMHLKYEKAKKIPGYSYLRQRTRVIGTWDDHDYGLNDAGKEFSGKIMSQKLLLDFLDEQPDSPRRKQDGVYASYMFGPEDKRIKIILLDTRYHRDSLSSDGSILGESQWSWLEKELYGPASNITIIASSIQVISNITAFTGPVFYMESWGRFPRERERLFRLIGASNRSGIFFISGDVHFGEITRTDCAVGYHLYDITSSGLTQAVEKAVPGPLSWLVRIVAWLISSPMRVFNQKCSRKSCTYGQPNFGAIQIDWGANPATIKVEVRNVDDNPMMGIDILLSDLRVGSIQRYQPEKGKLRKHCSLEVDYPWLTKRKLAILVFGVLIGFLLGILVFVIKILMLCRSCYRKCKLE